MVALIASMQVGYSQKQNSKAKSYISKYKHIAINNMYEFDIPASITMAQALLESGFGQSELAKKSNNHFGIKCKSYWKGEKVYHDDDEKGECFRKYSSVDDSYADHGTFLTDSPRYASLFKLKREDYKGWAKGLKKAGYATNPKYADILINMIELYELDKLDSAKRPKKRERKVRPNSDRVATEVDQIVNDEVVGAYILNGRKVLRKGAVVYTSALQGDTFESLSDKLKIKERKLKRYNKEVDSIKSGDIIYLSRARE